ncbi:hypothetical protein FKW77_007558 [Venturia effusa]|uniref:deuterolysin n=1 Tax=Venturia effusa TaxID=50376 RepID=A0A517L5Q6_9PEZI|nr:hypothetical protein FKW77_007558 [Venturia effusa]
MFVLFGLVLFATTCFSRFIPSLSSSSITDQPIVFVQLYHAGDWAIKATITNRGNTDLRILKPGSILDARSFSKFRVTHDGTPISFKGMVPNFAMNKWEARHFVTISAGQTSECTIDLSTTHDMTTGGTYQVGVNSILHTAQLGSNDIAGSISYQTNSLSLDLPKIIAIPSKTPAHALQRRARIHPDCSLQQLNNLTRASILGAAWAGAGAREALKPNSPVWNRYFRINASTEGATAQVLTKFHSLVSTRLTNIALELTSGVVSKIHCQADIKTTPQFQEDGNVNLCKEYPDQAIAYTIRATCQIALCPLYWKLENKNDECMANGNKGAFEQTGVLIHELTHCNTIGQVGFQPATDDLAYNWEDTTKEEVVTAGSLIQNAQSHALFAKASYVGGKNC